MTYDKLLEEVGDVMTPEDIMASIVEINAYREEVLQGSSLEQAVHKIARGVREFTKPPPSGGPPPEARWIALGLFWVSDQMVDFLGTSIWSLTREQLREKFEEMVADCEAEAAEDPKYNSPYTDEDKQVVEAWLSASPYTVWRMYQDAWEKAQDGLKEVFFEFVTGADSLNHFRTNIENQFKDSTEVWRKALLVKGAA